MRRFLTILTAALAIVLIAGMPTAATTIADVKLRCPACGHKFKAGVIASTNNFGGQDRDFYSHASGFPPILIYPITCRRCLYSGYRDDFEIDALDDETRALLRSRLTLPENLPPPDDSTGLPAWARYDLIILSAEIRGLSLDYLIDAALCASWAVREDAAPAQPLGDHYWNCAVNYTDSMMKELSPEGQNRAIRDVALARQLVPRLQSVPNGSRLCATLGVIILLRKHGELTEAMDLCRLIEPLVSHENFMQFADSMRVSNERERRYQQIALTYIEKSFEEIAPFEGPAGRLYLAGELCRRLERYDKALQYFRQAAQANAIPEGLDEWIDEQQALVTNILHKGTTPDEPPPQGHPPLD